MAAQSKTTAVHFSLIFFVMLSVILGVVAYLYYSDYREQQAAFTKNQSDLNAAKTAGTRYLEEVDALKKTIGLELPEVGVAAPGDNTVLTQSTQAIQTLGSDPAAASFMIALRDLRTEVDNKNVQLNAQQTEIASLQADIEALKGQYGDTAAEHDERRQATEQDLAGEQQQFAESVAAKDQEITQLREQNANLQTELEQTREQLGAELARSQEEISRLISRNETLREDLDEIKGESFEVADGRIVNVNQVERTVWIDLGSADNLKPRTTFSVYAKNNSGVGRVGRQEATDGRPEDIKASIEVTRILEDHLAEARILDDDTSRPIAKGDPVYTPLWSTGRTEKFAFVGMIDIDNDGSFTGDRERLHDVIEAGGAEIVSEVKDNGERLPLGRDGEPVRIDEQARFLVTGEIPDPLDVPDGEERDQRQLIMQHLSEMREEARTSGVRIINLNTFLDYIGYVPQQRRWAPGENKTWTLESGARRGSSGGRSGLLDTNRRGPSGAGTTSQTFGSGR